MKAIILIITLCILVLLTGCGEKYDPNVHDCQDWVCKKYPLSIYGISKEVNSLDIEHCGIYPLGYYSARCKVYSIKEKTLEEKYFDLKKEEMEVHNKKIV